ARVRSGAFARDARNARAAPWNPVWMLTGSPISRCTRSMAVTAAPSETPGARLNDTVTAGNWPWWLIASAVARSSIAAMVESGTWPPAADFRYTRVSLDGSTRNSGDTSRTTRYWLGWVTEGGGRRG